MARGVRGSGVRVSREQETHDALGVHDADDEPILFEESGPLPTIPSRAGYVQRWVRVATKQGDDARNLARMAQRGWKPRPIDTVPKAYQWLSSKREGLGGVIGTHDCILMERHEGIQQKAEAIQKQRRRDLETAVKTNLFREHKNIGGASAGITPDYESKATVERGRPRVADD